MIEFFARHPTAANLLMLLLVVVGLSALPQLKRESFPDFAATELEVRVPYPGASAEDVEEAVCQRLEDVLDGISEVAEVRCDARENLGITVVKMLDGADFARFLDDVKTEVEAIDSFPEETERPVIRELGRTDLVTSIAVTGPMSVGDLKAFAERLKDRLRQLPEVSQVEVQGFSEHQLRVEVSTLTLRQFGISVSELAEVIARQGIDLPAGSITTRDRELLIRFTDQRRTPKELEDLILVGGKAGGEIRLGDIAQVSDRFELDEDKVMFNGRRAALLAVTKTDAQDTLTVMDAVTAFLSQERERIPPGVSLDVTQNRSTIVRDRLELLAKNGLQGLLLVFLVMWLFFQFRFAFWVAMGLPVSFLGALFAMNVLGFSINMITMVALLIALGLLMDDAIVISENIAAHLRRGKSAIRAAVDGTRQVAPGVLSSFTTTVAVFTPLAFMAGDMGKVLKFIPMVLILVLAVSLIEAFLILPHHLAHALKGQERDRGRFRQAFNRRLDAFRDNHVGRLVDWAVHRRYLFAGLVVALFVVSVAMLASGHLKFQAFPDIEGDTIEARILLPQGTPLWRTEEIVARLEGALEQVNAELTPRQPEGKRLVKSVQVRFNSNLDAPESGSHLATINADLLGAEWRRGSLVDIVNRWRELAGEFPDVLGLSFKEPVIGPGGVPIEIRLSGPDLGRLKAAALELQAWLARYAGVFDLSDDLRPGKPEIALRLKNGALALGLDASAVAGQLRAAFYGTKAAEIQVGRESYEIDVRLAEADKRDLLALEDFRITAPNGAQVPLRAVAELSYRRGYSRVQRIDGVRTLTVQGDVDARRANVREIIGNTSRDFLPELRQRHPGVEIRIQGQSKESAKTGASLLRGFAIGLVGIFILLSFQFRSYIEPLVVMAIIPLALIGVVWGHLLMGLELSMPSMVGFASLAGIVVNDSILLVEFLKYRVREGRSTVDAAKIASRERFRAVLLTSLTTVAGLLPLLSEKSLQAQVLIPLAVSIVFGLIATTLLVLLVVPALFSILGDFVPAPQSGPDPAKARLEAG